jgi:hypothetical protein
MAHSFRGRNYGYNRYARYQFMNELEKGRRGTNTNSGTPWGAVMLLIFLLIPVFGCFISSMVK